MKKTHSDKLASFLLCLFSLLLVQVAACSKNNGDNALHLVMLENPKSLDPAVSSDALAAEATNNVYESLYQYHYLKRPYEVIPLLAEKMPEFSKDGLTVTLPIKKQVLFQDDACFKDGKGRELTAQDFIYAFKRLADPKMKSDGWWIFDGHIKGLNDWRENGLKKGQVDYAAAVEGLQAPDEHTLVLKLTKKYPQLVYVLAMVYTAPMAHEAIEKYGEEISSKTVGTGPFVITSYVRNSQIVYEKNKNYHGENFPADEGFSKKPAFKDFDYGKALPLVDKIVLHIMLEQQPAWLNFMKGKFDLNVLPKDDFDAAVTPQHELKPELVAKGIQLTKDASNTEWFLGFNMDDPIVGKNKLLRKAIGLAYDSKKDIEIFTNGRGQPANQILPPSITGFDPNLPAREVNVEKAKELLAKAGYPGGKGLPNLMFDTEGSSRARQQGEFFKSQVAQIGINVEVRVNTRPELFERKRHGKLQVHLDGWIADYPDAENFAQLLYGPNKPPGPNNSAFDNAEYNKLYEQMAQMAPSPERQKMINRMTAIMIEDAPWIPDWIATIYYLHQGWMKNYSYSDFGYNNYKYYGLDFDKKKAMQSLFKK